MCGGGSLGSIVWGSEAHACVILVLHKCFWNVPMVFLVLPAFDNTESLVYPPHWWSIPLVPPWVTASDVFAGNRKAEAKLTTFS